MKVGDVVRVVAGHSTSLATVGMVGVIVGHREFLPVWFVRFGEDPQVWSYLYSELELLAKKVY